MIIDERVMGTTKMLALIGNPVEHTISPLIHNTLSKVLNKNLIVKSRIHGFIIYSILTVHVLAGVIAYYFDYNYPFSQGNEVVNYIKNKNLVEYDFIGQNDFEVSLKLSLTGKQVEMESTIKPA